MQAQIDALKERRSRLVEAQREAAQAVDVFSVLGFEPICKPRVIARQNGEPLPEPCGQCPQEQFFSATEWDVFYGGAAGGSKTVGLLMYGIRACWQHPGIEVWAFRETYPELRGSFLKELRNKANYCKVLGATWNETNRELRFPSNSLLRFCYAEHEKDAGDFLSQECQALLVDERTRMLPSIIDQLKTRIRSGNPDVPVLGLRSASNPGGVGHGEVKAEYVDAGPPNTTLQIETEVDGRTVVRTRRFIPAKVDDNPHLGPDYLDTLDLVKDPRLRQAMRDGNWDTFAGQVFVEWNRDRHVVRPFMIPDAWRRIAGIDHGYGAPWAVEWGAIDNDGRVWVHRECYEAGVGEAAQAHRILAAEGALDPVTGFLLRAPGETVTRWADPSMWAKKGSSATIAEAYTLAGCVIHPATNDRLSGWQRVHSYLSDGPACEQHRALGWATCPNLHIFDTCTDLIRTLPALVADKHDPEDVDTNGEDHAADALRYALMSLQLPQTQRQPLPAKPVTLEDKVRADRDMRRAGYKRASRQSESGILGRY